MEESKPANSDAEVIESLHDDAVNPAETENVDADNETVKKKRKKEKEAEDYLHKINVDQVLRETGLDMDGLCKLIGIDYQTINRWKFGKDRKGNRPKYNAIIRMLRHGATTKTLFGVDTPSAPPEPQKIVLTDDLIAEMMVRAGDMLKKKNAQTSNDISYDRSNDASYEQSDD